MGSSRRFWRCAFIDYVRDQEVLQDRFLAAPTVPV